MQSDKNAEVSEVETVNLSDKGDNEEAFYTTKSKKCSFDLRNERNEKSDAKTYRKRRTLLSYLPNIERKNRDPKLIMPQSRPLHGLNKANSKSLANLFGKQWVFNMPKDVKAEPNFIRVQKKVRSLS